MDTGFEVMASRMASRTTREVPSSTFSAMLPVKPSATTTSAPAPGRSKPSRLPVKFSGPPSRRSRASSTSGVPLPLSSPTESSPTLGRSTPITASMNADPM